MRSGTIEISIGGRCLVVEFEYTLGSPDSFLEPGDPPEVVVNSTWDADTEEEVVLSTTELEAVEHKIVNDYLNDLSLYDED